MQASDPVDVAIIGGGPTGLFAAFYAGLRQMSTKLIDSLDVLGGQLSTLYPEKYVYDVAGFPKVLAKDLAARLIEQAMQYRPTVCLGQQVKTLDYDAEKRLYAVNTHNAMHSARSIVIAGGVGAFQPRLLALSNAKHFEGRGLSYAVQHVAEYAGKRILIIGGGDSAIDWANGLAPIAADVTLIHRRDEFRAHEGSVRQMRQTSVRVLVFYEIKEIFGDSTIESVKVYDNRTGAELVLPIDAILVNIGFVNSLGPMRNWGLTLQGNAIKVDSTMQTSRPGIFAAGDICTYLGKLKLIATGFGEATVAVNYAKNYLDPSAKVFPGHSSNMKAHSENEPTDSSLSDN